MIVRSSEQRKMLKTRAMMVEVICHGVMLVVDVSARPGSVSSLSLLAVSSISICDLPASNLEPYMFRISMVDGLSCRARCVCESAEDILRDASIERKKCLRLDVENSCEKSRRGHGLLRKCAWRQVKVVEGAMRDRADSLVK